MFGLQLEHLLLQNKALMLKSVGIPIIDIIAEGPYRQFANSKQKGCQIDYLVQMSTKNLYICEFKCRRKELTMDIVTEMKDRIDALSVSRGLGIVPVLFHLGAVSDCVATSGYFCRIIDISSFLSVHDVREVL